MAHDGWIGVDLDGTLAEYHGWTGNAFVIGKPVPKMVERIKKWLADGVQVRIVTARVHPEPWRYPATSAMELYIETMIEVIQKYTLKHVGQALPVTYKKDSSMIELWDDRAVQVVPNTGERADGKP